MVDSKSQKLRQTALPYPYRDNGLSLQIEEYQLEDEQPVELDQEQDNLTVDLAINESDPWEHATLRGEVNLPEDVVQSVYPPDERSSPPGKLYVAVRCPETIYRDRVDVGTSETEGGLDPGVHEVEISLESNDLRGKVQLLPFLVRSFEGDSDGQFATTPNVRLASGEPWTVVVDEEEESGSRLIEGEEAEFSEHDHLPGEKRLYHLDFRKVDSPKLWINSDHSRIVDILHANGSVGAEARMRDVVLDQIQQGVWSQLVVRAISDVDDEGEPRHDWERAVLNIFARDLTDEEDVTQASIQLREELNDPEGVAVLMERLDGAIQDYIDPRDQLINLIEEGLQI
ncbi:hypothetical protein [Halorubrum sp. PV6]|uniref:hypothetical protein n=1 Tax=Halorubrum sp. PV6 TaxID=634157 RepID=UPI001B3551BF|nr:hypothetical protein [Halorubrum sp. PV6]